MTGRNEWSFYAQSRLSLGPIAFSFGSRWTWYNCSWVLNKRDDGYSYTAWWLRVGPIAIAWRW